MQRGNLDDLLAFVVVGRERSFNGRELKARVDGQFICNGTNHMLNAALGGLGLAYVPADLAQPHLAKGRLQRVLADWWPPFSGCHLYYPSRRQSSAAFALIADALRHQGQ